MASICKPIIPSGILTASNRPVSADFDTILASVTNPLLKYDQKQIRLLTVLTNSLLQISNSTGVLNNYPSLKTRFEQSAITEEEFADFLDDSGLTPNYIQTTYTNDFPVQIDIGAINEAINEVQDALQELLNQIIADNLTSTIPRPTSEEAEENVFDPVIQPPPSVISSITWQPDSNTNNVLTQLDKYYEENFSAALNRSNLCAALTNPFTALASLIAAASAISQSVLDIVGFAGRLKEKVGSLISRLQNFSLGNLIRSLQAKLEGLKTQLLNAIENLKVSMRQKLENLKVRALELMNDIKNLPRSISSFISKKIRQIEDFLSDFNVDRMKAKLRSIFTINEDQFEDLFPAVLNLLGLKLCALASFVEGIMKKPLDEFGEFLLTLGFTFAILENRSVDITNEVLDAGGNRLPATERDESRTRQGETSNDAQQPDVEAPGVDGEAGQPLPGLIPKRHVVLNMSAEEREFVNNLQANYKDLFEFGESVKEMGSIARAVYEGRRPPKNLPRPVDHDKEWNDGENRPDSGWKMVVEKHPYIFAALARVARRLRADGLLSQPLYITSAYRSRYYNRIYLRGDQGVAPDSPHMHAMALDIDDDLSGLTSEGAARFIDYCSEEGFTRFGIYSGFIHIDIVGGTSTRIFENKRSSDRNIARAIENHRARTS